MSHATFITTAPLNRRGSANILPLLNRYTHGLTRLRPSPAPVTPVRSRRVSSPPSAMFGWLRQLVSSNATEPRSLEAMRHTVLKNPLVPPASEGVWPPPLQEATFGLGCFWGAERKFWKEPGVHTTSVGYMGGTTPKPNYHAVCTGRTGHAEVVNVVYDPTKTTYGRLLDVFWESHDPTTKNRQGNDVGTQYRSAIFYFTDEQKELAEKTRDHFNQILKDEGRNACSTEIKPAPEYFIAEEYHQQYLDKNPRGYCGLGGTGLYSSPNLAK